MKKITKKLFNPDLHEASDAIDRILKAKPKSGARHYIFLPHGRGAGVSTFCTFKILQFLETEKNGKALVLKQHSETIRECMEVFHWAINILGREDDYEISKHYLRIKHKGTNATVYFRGIDSLPRCHKVDTSIMGPVRILFFEDADQCDCDVWMNLAWNNLFDGESFKNSIALFSFNTPSFSLHWINNWVRISLLEMRAHGTQSKWQAYYADYRHMPKEWLGIWFFEHAKSLKKLNPKLYNNEYLGLSTEQ